jgi:hypothetical protein
VGPSSTGAAIAGGDSRRIGPGGVIIVPPGVAHWFSAIESDLDYLVFRVDPGQVLPAGYVHPLLQSDGSGAAEGGAAPGWQGAP